MKSFIYILSVCSVSILSACDYDNYKGPQSTFEGRIVYDGVPIGVSYNDVNFELWEPGWKKKNSINVPVDQDGNFSALLFDATYKLIIPSFQGPFMSLENDDTGSDTILVNLKGNTTMDIEVLPYYMIRNAQFSHSSGSVSASCQVEKIVSGVDERNVERVSLYISKTYFVDSRTSISSKDVNIADIPDLDNVSLSVTVPAISPAQSYVYARVGVKLNGVADMLFSPIQKVDL